MASRTVGGFEGARTELDPAAWRCLELAFDSLRNGGLACGSVITDPDGTVIAEGRNRAYDPPGGQGALQATPLAHAELNALAEIPTGRDLGAATLWSSQQPCSMCTAAVEFLGVGDVRFIATDPAFIGTAGASRAPDQAADVPDEWVVVANVLFLHNVIVKRGPQAEMVRRNQDLEPETTALALRLVDGRALADSEILERALAASWPEVSDAATRRRSRRQ